MSSEKPMFISREAGVVVRKEDTAALLREVLDANEIMLFSRLMHLDADNNVDDDLRMLQALDIAIEFLEQSPVIADRSCVIQPLNALRDRITPSLGQGRRAPSHDFLKAGGCAVVAVLRALGDCSAKEAQEFVAKVLTEHGDPVTWEAVRAWTKGAKAPSMLGRIKHALLLMGDRDPRDWFENQFVPMYRRRLKPRK